MSKSYPELLGDWVKRRASNRREKNVVAFLAVRDDVKAALDAGYPVKTIWTNMHESRRLTFSYDTFLSYVKRYIKRAETKAAKANVGLEAVRRLNRTTPVAEPHAQQPSRPKAPGPLPGFTFNADPRKEDLL